LFVKVVEGKADPFTNTVGNDGVDVFSILLPLRLLLVELDGVINFFEELMHC
jgi:hypothetical protein